LETQKNSDIGVGYYTPDGIIVSFNRLAALRMNGLPEDFAGKLKTKARRDRIAAPPLVVH